MECIVFVCPLHVVLYTGGYITEEIPSLGIVCQINAYGFLLLLSFPSPERSWPESQTVSEHSNACIHILVYA